MADLEAGQIIGRCLIERELGRGGMGAVYLARHTTLDVPVALKILPREIAEETPEFAKRFLREARLAAQLKHPNALTVMDADLDPESGLHYIVLEYVEGGTAGALIKEGPLDETRALAIITAVAKALDEAANHGIVHRDIKPDNILLTKDGDVKLADLGLARKIDDEVTGLTRSQSMMGTPFYMSPEQVRDAARADARSDIYSLGATLYHMVTGSPPFTGETVVNIIQAIMNSDTPDPRKARSGVSARTAALSMKMMAKDPDDRHQSPSELLTDLRGSGFPTFTKSGTVPKRGNSAALVGGAIVILALIILAITFSGGGEEEASPPSIPRGRVLAMAMDGEPGDSDYVPGKIDRARFFDGNSFMPLESLRPGTVAMWIRPDQPGQMGIFDAGASSRDRAFQIGIYSAGNYWDGTLRDTGVFLGFWQLDAIVPRDGIGSGWHHIVVSWDRARAVLIMVDGKIQDGFVLDADRMEDPLILTTQPFLLPRQPSPDAGQPGWIGRIRQPWWGKGSDSFTGAIDEFGVWDRALTPIEMRLLFDLTGEGKSYCGPDR